MREIQGPDVNGIFFVNSAHTYSHISIEKDLSGGYIVTLGEKRILKAKGYWCENDSKDGRVKRVKKAELSFPFYPNAVLY